MNTLKIEGAKNNIHTNAIAPVALTRMTENLIPEEAGKNLGPELITPAVTFLCSDDAPNGVVVQPLEEFLRGRHRGEHRGQPWRRGQGGRCGRGLVPDHGPRRVNAQHATARLGRVSHDGSPAGAGAGGGAWGERLALPGHAPAPHGGPSPDEIVSVLAYVALAFPFTFAAVFFGHPLAVRQAGLYASPTP